MLVRKDGLFKEMTYPSYLKPHSEQQEMLSRGVSLFPGEEICTLNKNWTPSSHIAQIKYVCLDGDSRKPGKGGYQQLISYS